MKNTIILGLSLIAATLLMSGCERDHGRPDSNDSKDYRMEIRQHDTDNEHHDDGDSKTILKVGDKDHD